MSKFKVGDRVKILPTSEWYGDGEANPPNVEGTINTIDNTDQTSLPIYVHWDDGTGNSYADIDLELIKQQQK